MTCRGSRFADGAKRNPNGEVFMKNRETDEWLAQNIRSTRNFIRKWGHFVKHDALMKPIVPPKYDIGFVVESCSRELLETLEPWCDAIYIEDEQMKKEYIEKEQSNTLFNLENKVRDIGEVIHETGYKHDIELWFDGSKFNEQSFQYIQQLSEILANDEELEVGEFELDIFKVTISRIKTYEKELINVI